MQQLRVRYGGKLERVPLAHGRSLVIPDGKLSRDLLFARTGAGVGARVGLDCGRDCDCDRDCDRGRDTYVTVYDDDDTFIRVPEGDQVIISRASDGTLSFKRAHAFFSKAASRVHWPLKRPPSFGTPNGLRIEYGPPGSAVDVTHVHNPTLPLVIRAGKLYRNTLYGKCTYVGADATITMYDGAGVGVGVPVDDSAVVRSWDADFKRDLPTFNDPRVLNFHDVRKSLPPLVGGSLNDEIPEQVMALFAIGPSATVLELGGNIGRNSCVIGRILDDSRRLVVLECGPSATHLRANRDAAGLQFHIEAAALSRIPLRQKEWITLPEGDVPAAEIGDWTPVPTITWPQLKAKYRHAFDTLVVDCEGALYYILKDEPGVLDGITTVVIENDFSRLEHKEFVDALFATAGLARQVVLPLKGHFPPPVCANRFFEVWVKRLK